MTLEGTVGWLLFGVVWSIALTGVILKLFFTGRYNFLSTMMYVVMGWLVLFAINPLILNLETNGLYWLMIGGVFYTIGAMFFLFDKLRFNHAIFHVFVLLGSLCHYISIYGYVN